MKNFRAAITEPAVFFRHPEAPSPVRRLKPVFLPFAGCPRRCFFCAQHLQSGCAPKSLDQIYDGLKKWLVAAEATEQLPVELGFYGGTFTALPQAWLNRFLNLAADFRARGLIYAVRASTRPDAVLNIDLDELRSIGLDCLELGVQSFSDPVLEALGRGYDGASAALACRKVRDSGMALGLHLMPGSPGMDEMIFAEDVARVIELAPEFVRLHPFLVLAGTPLEKSFHAGLFSLWDISRTVRALSSALSLMWGKRIRCARIGLAAEESLRQNIVAGPWHPCLGLMVRSFALYRLVRDEVIKMPDQGLLRLFYPRRFCGEIWGYKRSLLKLYEQMGLSAERVKPWDHDEFCLCPAQE